MKHWPTGTLGVLGIERSMWAEEVEKEFEKEMKHELLFKR